VLLGAPSIDRDGVNNPGESYLIYGAADTELYPVTPSSGSNTGGYQVIITGENLGNGSDITNVTLCGVNVASIDSQSATQVVVTVASAEVETCWVVVYSTSYGQTSKADAFSLINTHIVYVDASVAASGDGSSWATAMKTIQEGVDAAGTDKMVLVTNGLYDTGERAFTSGTTKSRVCITNPITVRSVNGPDFTFIKGEGPIGNSAVRCAYLCAGAQLTGFTLTNGYTASTDYFYDLGEPGPHFRDCGGGVLAEDSSAVISNCVLTGNSAGDFGGGAYQGTLNNCTLTENSANYGGGTARSILNNCELIGNTAGFLCGGGGAFDATLTGCTLTGNSVDSDGYGGGAAGATLTRCTIISNTAEFGGGVANIHIEVIVGWDEFWNPIYDYEFYYAKLDQCRLIENTAAREGGGAYGGRLNNCLLTGNTAEEHSGGAYLGRLNNCTVVGNTASECGGVKYGDIQNCIVYYNTSDYTPADGNYSEYARFTNSCTTPLPPGDGNFTNAPGISGLENPHLLASSPCIDAGLNDRVAGSLDIDGEARTNGISVDIGCDEYWPANQAGPLTADITPPAVSSYIVGYPMKFEAVVTGYPDSYTWTFGDGTSVSDIAFPAHAYATAGVYEVVLRVTNLTHSAMATVQVEAVASDDAIWYVKPNGSDGQTGKSWFYAKATIQSAVNAAQSVVGATVLVSNGVYNTGGISNNRVCITSPITVRSVNGASVTTIESAGAPGYNRCVYMTEGTTLSGFTLTNGYSNYGGGVHALNEGAVVSNCVIVGNYGQRGGGAYQGTLNNCILKGNQSKYGGGGAYGSSLNNCEVIENYCADSLGGGVRFAVLRNCTVSRNSSYSVGGAEESTLYNCIVWENIVTNTNSGIDMDYGSDAFNTCSSDGVTHGEDGNITSNPLFVDANEGDFTIQEASPCRNAGDNTYAPTNVSPFDLLGLPRIAGTIVDMGAHEAPVPILYITATASAHGSVDPDGVVAVEQGLGITFDLYADTYYQVTDVLTNSTSCGVTGIIQYAWSNIQTDGTFHVVFDALTTSNNTPFWWLAQHGWTQDFEIVELLDPDSDTLLTWQEYQLNTIPTNSNSDGDQFDDGTEWTNGADPARDDSQTYGAIAGNPSAFGYYSSNNIGDLAYGNVMLTVSGDMIRVYLDMMESTDLSGGWTNVDPTVMWEKPATSNVYFYRFIGE